MSYLLDSNVLISLLANDEDTEELLVRFADSGVSISVISYMEVSQGFHQKRHAPRTVFESLIESFALLPVDQAIAERCAQIRAHLALRRRRVRPRSLDLLIAATAIEHDLTLVTRNVDDYQDVPGLRIHR